MAALIVVFCFLLSILAAILRFSKKNYLPTYVSQFVEKVQHNGIIRCLNVVTKWCLTGLVMKGWYISAAKFTIDLTVVLEQLVER